MANGVGITGQAPPAEQLQRVRTLLANCPKLGARPYAPDIASAARQLVVAEIVDAYRVHCGQAAPKIGSPALRPLDDFYEGPRNVPGSNRFFEHYKKEWHLLRKLGIEAYLAQPARLADLEQMLQNSVAPADATALAQLLKPVAGLSTMDSVALDSEKSLRIFACAVTPTELSKQQAVEGARWMLAQGYDPVPIAFRETPGGAHRDGWKRPPCDDRNNQFKGMYVLAGLYPGRTACTIRHEALHSIYHQIERHSPTTMRAIKQLYAQAMRADTGLIFNDEYYMGYFIHAGHPMHNDNEFFAGAAHAFTHHADLLITNINNPRTSKAARDYAIAMWKLLRDAVFHGRVFTDSGNDPFK